MEVKRSDMLVNLGKVRVSGELADWLESLVTAENNKLVDSEGIRGWDKRVTVEDVIRAIIKDRWAQDVIADYRREVEYSDTQDDDLPF